MSEHANIPITINNDLVKLTIIIIVLNTSPLYYNIQSNDFEMQVCITP